MARGRWMTGFSLVELMAAVGIVSVLVSLALPRYRLFIARSRMAEAKTNLGIIYGLQQTYRAEFETWGNIDGGMGGCSTKCTGGAGQQDKNELGFRVTDCTKLRYEYNKSGGSQPNFNAVSLGTNDDCKIYPNCTAADKTDEWDINANRHLRHAQSVIKKCHD